MSEDNTPTLPIREDGVSPETEAELFAKVLEQSSLVNAYDENGPIEQEAEVPPAEGETEESEVTEEAEEVAEESEESEESEETQEEESENYIDPDELDLEVMTTVTVDGEKMEVSFGDLIKNYQTDSHLGREGRKLGEDRKAFEEERVAKINELESTVHATSGILMEKENAVAKEYHELKTKFDELSEDDYDYDKLERQVERKQKEYWAARRSRESLVNQVAGNRHAQMEKQWNEQVETFYSEITDVIPEWTEEYNEGIKQFAIEEGIPEEFLNYVTQPEVVKVMDDYRKLKQGVSEGAVKRKTAPVKKAIPSKKGKPQNQRKAEKEAGLKSKVLAGEGSKEDQLDFLKSISKSPLVR